MSESMKISLQVPAECRKRPTDLQTTINQIVSQKGAFRHVTEQSLLVDQESSENDQFSGLAGEQEPAVPEENETPQARLEKLWKGREEMLQHLDRAQNEVLTTLDFLSLLLSKQSAPAQGSMSPALKQAVPVGSIEARVTQPTAAPRAFRKRLEQTSHGWRSQAFESAYNQLASASTRLRTEADRESKFWEQVAVLKRQGWAVSRHPRDSKAIGVHFGFTESAPQFRNKGFVLLRQDDASNVYLDQNTLPDRQRIVKVVVRREDSQSHSYPPFDLPITTDVDVSGQLMQARNMLFEEELFYEISREARTIASYDVTNRAHAVQFDVLGQYQVSLSLEDASADYQLQRSKEYYDLLAHFIGLSIRTNLIKAHEQNLSRRSQAPAPISTKVKSDPEYAILRPLIAALRHSVAFRTLRNSINGYLKTLSTAGIQIAVQHEELVDLKSTTEAEIDNGSTNDATKPMRSLLRVHLPSARSFEVTIASLLGPPVYGTRFETNDLDYGFAHLKAGTYDTIDNLLYTVTHVLTYELASLVASWPNTLVASGSAGLPEKETGWVVSRPLKGELSFSRQGKSIGKMKIDVEPDNLGLSVKLPIGSKRTIMMTWNWGGDKVFTMGGVFGMGDAEGFGSDSESFSDVINNISKLGGR